MSQISTKSLVSLIGAACLLISTCGYVIFGINDMILSRTNNSNNRIAVLEEDDSKLNELYDSMTQVQNQHDEIAKLITPSTNGQDTVTIAGIRESESPELHTPTSTRTPRPTNTPPPTATDNPTPTETSRPISSSPSFEAMCSHKTDAILLHKRMTAAGMQVELERVTYRGRQWPGVVGPTYPRDRLGRQILEYAFGCSIKKHD